MKCYTTAVFVSTLVLLCGLLPASEASYLRQDVSKAKYLKRALLARRSATALMGAECDSDLDKWRKKGDNKWHECASNSECSTSDASAGCQCNEGYHCLSSCDNSASPDCSSACDDPTLTNVETSNIQFVSSGVDTVEFYCNNTDSGGDSTLDCEASFSLTKEYSQSGTLSSSFTAAISESVKIGEDLLVEDADYEVSATLSATVGLSETQTVSETYSLESSCKVKVQPNLCETLSSTTTYGKMTADYTGTLTCGDGSSGTVSGTFTFDGVASTAEITDCTVVDSC